MEPKDNEPQYPEEYDHLRDEVNDVVEQLKVYDTQIEYWEQQPKGQIIPPPALKPEDAPAVRQQTREEKLAELKGKREELQRTTSGKVEKATMQEPDPQKQRLVRDMVREKVYGNKFKENEFKHMTTPTMQTARAQFPEFELEQSQDFMDALRGRRQPEPPSVDDNAQDSPPPNTLHYNVALNLIYTPMTGLSPDANTHTGATPTTEKEEEVKSKPCSIAELASQALRYTQMTQKTDQTTDKAPEPDKTLESDKTPTEPTFEP